MLFTILLMSELTKVLITAVGAIFGGSMAAAVVTYLANRKKLSSEVIKMGSDTRINEDSAVYRRLEVLEKLCDDLQDEQAEQATQISTLKRSLVSYKDWAYSVMSWRQRLEVKAHLKEIEEEHPFPDLLEELK